MGSRRSIRLPRTIRFYRRRGFFLRIFVVLAFAGLAAPVAAQTERTTTPSSERHRTIVVGRVSDDPKKHFSRLEKMATYLAQQLGDLGIDTGKVVLARNANSMTRLLREGKVDFISETPFSAIQFIEEGGAELLLREWKKGVAAYRTVFYSRKEDGVTSLADLRGKKVAFEDPGSTTAFLVPLAMLRLEGLDAVELSSIRDEPPADKVGYAFARSELNMALWVTRGIADAGAFSNLDWDDFSRTPNKPKQALRIFQSSKPIMRSVLLVRGGLQPEVKARIKEILLNMHTVPEGKDILNAYDKVKKYDEIEGEAAASLAHVRRMVAAVRDELNR